MSDPLPLGLTRRHFLAGTGALAGAVALAACGGGDDKESTSDTTGKYVLANYFSSGQYAAGQAIRAPFGLAESSGALLTTKQSPSELELLVLDKDDQQVGEALVAKRRDKGLPRPYYTVETTLPEPGIYSIKAKGGIAAGNSMALDVSDPKDLRVMRPGLALPAMQTPTMANPQGVTPVCTRTPACPLHEVTVAQALAEQRPIGLIVSTPGYCKVAICGPVLELVLDQVADHPGIRFIHAEVYADPVKSTEIVSPTVNALGLPFEPVLFLTGPDGKVQQRLDSIWDTAELSAALKTASS